MRYTPRDVPSRLEELPDFLHEELQAIANATGPKVVLQAVTSHREPERIHDGMIVLADGTDWNPGSGQGFYGYYAAAWHFLG